MSDDEWMAQGTRPAVDLKTDVPHAARIYDALLGGKTNYGPDRAAAEQVARNIPSAQVAVRAQRDFVLRATRYLAAEAGVRQFLDIGTGIPTSPNLHEVAQGAASDSRVVYVDNDPIVLAHSRALHTSTPEGRTAYVEADVQDPGAILEAARATLDFGAPVAVSMCLLLHWLPPTADPYALVRQFTGTLVEGSHLVVTYLASDLDPSGVDGVSSALDAFGSGVKARTRDEVARFFDGLTLVEPGIVVPQRWRPERAAIDVGTPEAAASDEEVPIWAGVAAKRA